MSEFVQHSIYNLKVSAEGQVLGPRGSLRRFRLDKDGYLRFNVGRHKKIITLLVHRLVAEVFLGPRPEGYTVNHKNCDKQDNRAENLEYVTAGENVSHGFRSGCMKKCQPVIVLGRPYYSLRAAERGTGIPRHQLRVRAL